MFDAEKSGIPTGSYALLEDAQNLLNELQERISPILVPANEEKGENEKAPVCSSMLERVQLMHNQLKSMLNRVQL